MDNAVTKQDLEDAFARFSQYILHEMGLRFDKIGKRFDEVNAHLARIDDRLARQGIMLSGGTQALWRPARTRHAS